MLTLIMLLLIVAAAFLIALVLVQPGKADMSAAMGGISSQMGSMFGMQKSVNILAKITKVVAVIILFVILATNRFIVPNSSTHNVQVKKVITEGQNIPTPTKLPGQLPGK